MKITLLIKPVTASILLLILLSPAAWGADLTGLWQEYDDDTGKVTALIRIQAHPDDTYEGVIEKVLIAPDQNPEQLCTRCTGDLHNRPLLGLRILSGMRRKDRLNFEGGEVLDPDDGKTYRCQIQLSEDGNKLQITGYLSSTWIGQSEVWVRAK